MIFAPNQSVRLTKGELNLLRQAAAKNGIVVNHIRTRDELLQATIDGLPPKTQDDLLEFLKAVETDRSGQ
ncbi:MAG: hypothetical protein ACJ8R9_05405 [Steroidobacteraceae bacterium]